MKKHCDAAIRLLADLDAELAASGDFSWSTADEIVRELAADTMDVIEDLDARYQLGGKDQMRVATELRLTRTTLARLVTMIKTDIPDEAPKSITSIKAKRAADQRWNAVRNAAG